MMETDAKTMGRTYCGEICDIRGRIDISESYIRLCQKDIRRLAAHDYLKHTVKLLESYILESERRLTEYRHDLDAHITKVRRCCGGGDTAEALLLRHYERLTDQEIGERLHYVPKYVSRLCCRGYEVLGSRLLAEKMHSERAKKGT